MRIMRSLRGQLASSAAALVLLIVALSGVVIVLQIDTRERATLDATLQTRLSRVGEDLGKIIEEGHESSDLDPDTYGGLLAGSDSLVRLIIDGTVVAQRGEIPDQPLAPPSSDGFDTVTVDGQPWRSLTVDDASGVQLQVLESLAPIQERLQANAWLVALVTLAATLVAMVGGWLVARLLLHPLELLTAGASAIRADHDVSYRVPDVRGPQEIAELSETLNGMLERLHRAMQSTKRFTADAGHELRTPLSSLGAYLEILTRNPGLPEARRSEILASATAEHERVAALLDGLQTLARGDVEALPDRESVDLVDLADEAVRHARSRHPSVSFTFRNELPEDVGLVRGWREGIRLVLNNLLNNAAIHGRPSGTVTLTLSATDSSLRITVDDDGRGIPEAMRDAVRERFARGDAPGGPGSGLGLALVEQQASLHGGRLVLADSSAGGLSASVSLPTIPGA